MEAHLKYFRKISYFRFINVGFLIHNNWNINNEFIIKQGGNQTQDLQNKKNQVNCFAKYVYFCFINFASKFSYEPSKYKSYNLLLGLDHNISKIKVCLKYFCKIRFFYGDF